MKFQHFFQVTEQGDCVRKYRSDGIHAQLDFLSGSMLRVALYPDGVKPLPTFTVDPNNELLRKGRDRLDKTGFPLFSPLTETTGDRERFTLKNGIEVTLERNNFLLSYTLDGKELFSDRAPLAYNFQKEFGDRLCHYITRERDERIFGLGDKGGSMNKAGRLFRIDTSDSMGYDAETTDPLYKHVPFYICENSVGSYGIYYDTSDVSLMNLGQEINNYYAPYKYFQTQDDCLVYYVFFGTKLEILKQYVSLCGRQILPPRWYFDYCGSTMAYTDAPNAEEEMDAFLQTLKELDLHCSGFYLSSGYTSVGPLRCVFHWNRDKFPDPKRFVKRFKQEGIHLIPNIKPAFLTSHPKYREIAERGLFVKDADGKPFITEFWDGMGSYLDFTLPEAFDFWHDQVGETLLDYGIDATWNDNNEFDIKDTDAVAFGFDGTPVKASRIRPLLTYLMVLSSYLAQTEKEPDKRPLLSTRSGNSAVRRLSTTWSGDNYTSFHDLYYCHFIGLTLSLSGFYFYGHDLGGFSGDMPSKELLLRWMQHGLFEPRFTIHSWNKDGTATMPWSYPEALPAARQILAERKRLLPYLYNAAYQAVTEELPMNAPLFLYYDDPEISPDSTSFLVGRNLLATCILEEGKQETVVYLPRNEVWYLGDKQYEGGQEVPLFLPAEGEVPYFVRGGSVIATDEGKYGYQGEAHLRFTVFPIKQGTFTDTFFTDDGESFAYQKNDCVKLCFNVTCDSQTVTVQVENRGEQELNPELVLCPADKRKLILV